MRGTRRLALGAGVMSVAVFSMAGSALAAKLYVSPTGDIATRKGTCAKPNAHTIQGGITAANAGDTVIVCPGTYPEFVQVAKKLILQGQPGATVIPPLDETAWTGPLVLAGRVDHVQVPLTDTITVKGLTVDGQNRAGAVGSTHEIGAPVGIRGENANVVISGNNVLNVTYPAAPGDQTGAGILVSAQTGLAAKGNVNTNTVSHIQKNSIEFQGLDGGNVEGTINGNSVTGAGLTPDIAQNGIEVSFGAVATVQNNQVSDYMYGQPGDNASGILVYQAGAAVKVQGNVVTRFDYGIDVEDSASALITANTVTGGRSGDPSTMIGCNTDVRGIVARFFGATGAAQVTISNNQVSDTALTPDLAGCQQGLGIYTRAFADEGAPAITSNISGNTVSTFDKNGITVNGDRNTGKLTLNTIDGGGSTSAAAKNMIQFGFGATGTIGGKVTKGNHLNNIGAYTGPADASAAGILLFGQPDGVRVNGNDFHTNGVDDLNGASTRGGYVIALGNSAENPDSGDVDASKNTWGTTDTSTIAQWIYDGNDEPGLGIVDFTPLG
jgi:hypothetical protein